MSYHCSIIFFIAFYLKRDRRFFRETGIYHLSSISFFIFSLFIRIIYYYSSAKFIPACRHERGVVALIEVDDSCRTTSSRRDAGHIRDIYPYYKQESRTPPLDLLDRYFALHSLLLGSSDLDCYTRLSSSASLKPPAGRKPFKRAMRSWCFDKSSALQGVFRRRYPPYSALRRSCNFSSNVAQLIKSIALNKVYVLRLSVSLLRTRLEVYTLKLFLRRMWRCLAKIFLFNCFGCCSVNTNQRFISKCHICEEYFNIIRSLKRLYFRLMNIKPIYTYIYYIIYIQIL